MRELAVRASVVDAEHREPQRPVMSESPEHPADGEPPPPPPPPSETEGSPHGPSPADARPFGVVIAEAEDTFLLVGQGVGLDFSRADANVEIDSVEEGRFDAGRWVPGRALNGDERLFLLPFDDISAVRIRLLHLPCPTAEEER